MSEQRDFRDSEAQRIIQRAAEIDAQRGQSIEELRQIAAEAGISPAAVDQAIQERLGETEVKPFWVRRGRGILISIAIVAGLLFFAFMRMVTPAG
jgi:parvulin-like peptidyl-prolyl isomerase